MTYFSLFAHFAAVALVSASTGLSYPPCHYMQPNISAQSGPLELLILTAGFPTAITFPEKGVTFNYKDPDGCVSETGRIDCHAQCSTAADFGGRALCWFKVTIPDVTGLNAMHVKSSYRGFENIQGIYRPHSEYDENNYFLKGSGIVTCTTDYEVSISWTVLKPEQSETEVECLYRGFSVQEDASSLDHELSLYRGDERFESATCAVNHNGVWIYSPRFVFWQDALKFIHEGNGIYNKTAELKNGTYALTWSVEMLEPSLDQPFRCVANSRPICSGLTVSEEPGKCQIKMNSHGFLFTYLWNSTVERPGAFYCYLDKMVLAKSVQNYGPDEDKVLLEMLIWQRLLKAHFSLDNTGSPLLKIIGLHIGDVSCERLTAKDDFLCGISPPNLRLHWIVKIKDINIVARVAQLKEPVYFTGFFSRCSGCDSRFTINNPQYDLQRPFQPPFIGEALDVASTIRRILEEAFNNPLK